MANTETNITQNTIEKKDIKQFIKFVLFSISAGAIQIISFTLMNELLIKAPFLQNLMAQNETFAKIMQNDYGPFYVIALVLSVLWNFTFNRKFTFKAANNIKIAMLKVFGYYLVFTPVSTVLGVMVTKANPGNELVEYVVLGVTMITNMVTEFLFCKFVVYREKPAEE